MREIVRKGAWYETNPSANNGPKVRLCAKCADQMCVHRVKCLNLVAPEPNDYVCKCRRTLTPTTPRAEEEG